MRDLAVIIKENEKWQRAADEHRANRKLLDKLLKDYVEKRGQCPCPFCTRKEAPSKPGKPAPER